MIEPTTTQKAAEAAFHFAWRGRSRFSWVPARPKPRLYCVRRNCANGLLHAITLAEFLDAASGVDNLLLAGIERMAGSTDFDVQLFFAQRGAGYESVATRAGDSDFFVIGVNAGFHGNSLIG
jgi:hypothetical protein